MLILTNDKSNYVSGFQDKIRNDVLIDGIYVFQDVTVKQWEYDQNGPGTDDQILVLMPGMRWEKSKKRAIQLSIIGVFSEEYKFVLPMASWFVKI
jgi:hypothetical protein